MGYEPQQTKNIADLEEVSVDLTLDVEVHQDGEGKDFTIQFVELNGEKYRVPTSVISALKVLLEDNPNLQKFKVLKTGAGMETRYQVIPL